MRQGEWMWRWTAMTFLVALSVVYASGCSGKKTAPEPEKLESASKALDAAAGGEIGSVVFVDQENCCDCTRTRQAATWANLQSVLGTMTTPPKVELVHLDTQSEDAQLYLDLKPIMVSPGLYFFDGSEVLVEMLQGEVTVEQIGRVLQ